MAQTQTGYGTIAAYFEDNTDARNALEALQQAGFTSAHLGVAHRGAYSSTDYSDTGTSRTSTDTTSFSDRNRDHAGHHAGESTWEKIKQWFSGEDEEDVIRREDPIPNTVATQDRVDPGYDDTSDLHGSFTALNVPEERSRYFAHRFGRGSTGAVVTVQAGNRVAEAEEILARYNADLGENAASYDYSQNSTNTWENESDTRSNAGLDTDRSDSPRNIQLLGEVLRVHKDRVNRGEVKVRKEVVTENQTVQVPVQREELVVERRSVQGGTPATGSIGEEEVRIPLSEERARLDKATEVREEVSIGKKPVEQVRDLTGEVRHEELNVDDETKRERSA